MIWTSAQEPIVAEDTTLAALIEQAATAHPGRPALVDAATGAGVSYAELSAQVTRASAGLRSAGLGPGDCLALWAPNSPTAAVQLLAALRLGASVTGLDPAATDHEVGRQVGDAGASVVVTVAELAQRACAFGCQVVALGSTPSTPSPTVAPDILHREAGEPAANIDAGDPDAIALLPYSSGTTGLPKRVMLTNRQVVTVSRQIGRAVGVHTGDVTLAVAPWFHIMGVTAELLVPLARGATVVTMPRFEPSTFLDHLAGYEITYVVGPPPVAAVHRTLADRAVREPVGQGWGLTETSGALCVPRRPQGTAPGTVGTLLPDTELRVVDVATRRPLGADAAGELEVRGPQTMLGYLHEPDATAAMIDDDGWLRTGDLGYVQRGGDVVVVDRLKELIKVNAHQVAPAEVEAALVAHPSVTDAAVVGLPHDRTGQTPVAHVVTDGRVAPDELAAWIATRLAPYKRPSAIHVVDELPRTRSGKLLRRQLRADAMPAT